MASRLGIAVSTVQGWKMRGAIPDNRWHSVVDAARAAGIDLATIESAPVPSAPESPAEPPVQSAIAAAVGDSNSNAAPISDSPAPTTADSETAPETVTMTDTVPEPVVEEEAPRRSGGAIAWSALLVGVIALVAIFTRPVWSPFVQPFVEPVLEQYLPSLEETEPPAPPAPAVADTEAMQELAQRITALEGKIDRLVRLNEEITRIENRLQGLATAAESAGDAPMSAIEELQQRVATLETAAGGGADLSTALQSLERQIAGLESSVEGRVSETAFFDRIGAVENRVAAFGNTLDGMREDTQAATDEVAALREQMGTYDARLDDIANRPVQTGARAAAVVLAVGQLESAVLSGEPYRAPLDQMSRLAGEDAGLAKAIEALDAGADDGVPTRTDLTRQFLAIAPVATGAAREAAAEDWLTKTWARLANVVSVRRVDGEGPAAPISTAEQALDRNDLATAVDALKGMQGPAAAWAADAEARLQAETALADLRSLSIDRLSAADAALASGPAQ